MSSFITCIAIFLKNPHSYIIQKPPSSPSKNQLPYIQRRNRHPHPNRRCRLAQHQIPPIYTKRRRRRIPALELDRVQHFPRVQVTQVHAVVRPAAQEAAVLRDGNRPALARAPRADAVRLEVARVVVPVEDDVAPDGDDDFIVGQDAEEGGLLPRVGLELRDGCAGYRVGEADGAVAGLRDEEGAVGREDGVGDVGRVRGDDDGLGEHRAHLDIQQGHSPLRTPHGEPLPIRRKTQRLHPRPLHLLDLAPIHKIPQRHDGLPKVHAIMAQRIQILAIRLTQVRPLPPVGRKRHVDAVLVAQAGDLVDVDVVEARRDVERRDGNGGLPVARQKDNLEDLEVGDFLFHVVPHVDAERGWVGDADGVVVGDLGCFGVEGRYSAAVCVSKLSLHA